MSFIFGLYCYVFENDFFYLFLTYLIVLNFVTLNLIHKNIYFSRVSEKNSSIDKKVNFLNYDSQNNIYYSESVEKYWKLLQVVLNSLEDENKRQVQDFKDKKFRIIIGHRDELSSLNSIVGKRYSRINGQFQISKKFIIVYVDDINGKELEFSAFLEVFYHEWGHFVDYRLNFVSKTRYFKNKFKLFMDSILSNRVSFICKRKNMGFLGVLKCKFDERKLFYDLNDESESLANVYSVLKRVNEFENCSYPKEIVNFVRTIDKV